MSARKWKQWKNLLAAEEVRRSLRESCYKQKEAKKLYAKKLFFFTWESGNFPLKPFSKNIFLTFSCWASHLSVKNAAGATRTATHWTVMRTNHVAFDSQETGQEYVDMDVICFSSGSRLFETKTLPFPKGHFFLSLLFCVSPVPPANNVRFNERLDVHWTFQLHPLIPLLSPLKNLPFSLFSTIPTDHSCLVLR